MQMLGALLIKLNTFRPRLGFSKNFNEAVVLGKRYPGKDALDAGIVDGVSKGADVLLDAKQMASKAICLSQGGYDRDSLQNMKKSVCKTALVAAGESHYFETLDKSLQLLYAIELI